MSQTLQDRLYQQDRFWFEADDFKAPAEDGAAVRRLVVQQLFDFWHFEQERTGDDGVAEEPGPT
jgi:hypothetical protein